MATTLDERISIGVPALDEILDGGLIPGNAYLVRGTPGTGKTLLGLHFLAQGAQAGDPTLFIALSEPSDRVRANAQMINVDISDVVFLDLTPGGDLFADDRGYDIFTPAEVERGPITEQIVAKVREVKPQRIFLDAVTQLRYLSGDEQEFRRQTFSMLRYLTEAGATVLYSSESASAESDIDLQFMSDGVIELGREGGRRTVQVLKLRSSDYQAGFHGMRIDDDGMHVFPRIVPSVRGASVVAGHKLATGIAKLDEMLRGGLEAGAITMISGPLGIGKTTLGLQILRQAAQQGTRGVVYLFEEAPASVMQRAEAIGMSLEALTADGRLMLEPIEPLRMTAQEFAYQVRQQVEMSDVRMVMLDSVSGYRLSLRGEDLVAHLHALSRYLRGKGVTVLLINETELGREPLQSADPSIGYLADNVLFLCYLESDGMLQPGIGVLKRRLSAFDRALYHFELRDGGIEVGDQIRSTRGNLYGVPKFEP